MQWTISLLIRYRYVSVKGIGNDCSFDEETCCLIARAGNPLTH